MLRTLPRPIRLFLVTLVTLSAACLLAEFVCAFLLHLPHPYSWPLTPINEFGYDLNGFAPKFQHFHSPVFFSIEPQYSFSYPAPMALLYWLVYRFPGPREIFFAALVSLTFAAGCALLARRLHRAGLSPAEASLCGALLLVFAYPVAFDIKQGNLEFVVFLLISGGIWLFLRGRGHRSAACFALAGSLKIFPLIFLGLHLAQRRYRPILLALALLPAFELLSLWLVVPDIPFAYYHLQANIAEFQQKIMLEVLPREIGFDHSLFSIVKRVWLLFGPQQALAAVLRTYLALTAMTGTALFFTRIRHLPVTNQILALVVCSILLPPVSYDYTLIHLYLPLAMLLVLAASVPRQRGPQPGTTAVLVVLAASLAPLSELILYHVQFGGQVRALLLLALLILALRYPLPAPTPGLTPDPDRSILPSHA